MQRQIWPGIVGKVEEMAGATCIAVGRAEAFQHNRCAGERGDPLVLATFLTAGGRIAMNLLDPSLGGCQQIIDVPEKLFLPSHVPAQPRAQAIHRAAGVDVDPSGKKRHAQLSHTDFLSPLQIDDQAVAARFRRQVLKRERRDRDGPALQL